MASTVWEEVQSVKSENRRELTLQGPTVNKRIEDSGLDNAIFALTSLNLLKVAGTPLETISGEISNLVSLTSLILANNKLVELPSTIGSLISLKTLDVSGNKLQSLPESLSELKNLQSLNANLNELSSFPDVSGMKLLAYLSISRNKLKSLPSGICDPSLSLLSTVDAAHNEIVSLPAELSNLPHLITLNVAANKLEALPAELSECPKLKEVIIAENKMKDRKLLKLAEHSSKSLLNYLSGQLEKQRATEEGGKSKKEKSRKKKKGGNKTVEDLKRDVVSVLQFETEKGLTVTVTPEVLGVRPYLVCCIIKDVDFSKSNNMFKRFINLQTKLHDSICEKRQVATIATHDLGLVKGPLLYTAALPHEIQITPLFKSQVTTAEVLMQQLTEEAESYRKEKKRSTLGGIHKYLDLLKDKSLYPCLQDASSDVISFPPITNSEKTKISRETRNVLLEVSSSTSLDLCKKVMEELLLATLLTGVGTPTHDETVSKEGEDRTDRADEEKEDVDMSRVRVTQQLTVEQVKVMDSEGNLRVIYPSRIDLQNPAFDVVRNYE